jgi:hypothetical protein
MKGATYECMICPRLRRLLCIFSCTPEINAKVAAMEQAQDERDARYLPPSFSKPLAPFSTETMSRRAGRLSRLGENELR